MLLDVRIVTDCFDRMLFEAKVACKAVLCSPIVQASSLQTSLSSSVDGTPHSSPSTRFSQPKIQRAKMPASRIFSKRCSESSLRLSAMLLSASTGT